MPESTWLFDIRSNNGGAIPNATALGSAWMTRNVSSLVNTVFYINAKTQAHWRENDGYSDSEWFDAQSEPEGPPVQNGSRLQLAHVIFEHYRAGLQRGIPRLAAERGPGRLSALPGDGLALYGYGQLERVSPADKEIVNRVLVNYGKSIEAFLRKLVSRNAPFDQYVAGDRGAISLDAKQGLKLFVG